MHAIPASAQTAIARRLHENKRGPGNGPTPGTRGAALSDVYEASQPPRVGRLRTNSARLFVKDLWRGTQLRRRVGAY